MSDTNSAATETDDADVAEIEVPADPLAGHPATAYFWGHVAGSGDVSDSGIEVVTNDEESAQVLAAVAGGDLEHETTTRDYAHDTSITRTEDEYTLSIGADDGAETDDSGLLGRSSALGLPVDGRGNYRFGAFSSYDRELLRGCSRAAAPSASSPRAAPSASRSSTTTRTCSGSRRS